VSLTHGCEPADCILLDNRFDAVVAGPQATNQSFSLRIARHRNRQIGISREPRFGTRRNGQAADQREGNVRFSEIGVDPA
jgi:hypothetical protein